MPTKANNPAVPITVSELLLQSITDTGTKDLTFDSNNAGIDDFGIHGFYTMTGVGTVITEDEIRTATEAKIA